MFCYQLCRRPDKWNSTGIWFDCLCWIDLSTQSIIPSYMIVPHTYLLWYGQHNFAVSDKTELNQKRITINSHYSKCNIQPHSNEANTERIHRPEKTYCMHYFSLSNSRVARMAITLGCIQHCGQFDAVRPQCTSAITQFQVMVPAPRNNT